MMNNPVPLATVVTPGVLVMSNFGRRENLVIHGVPVGRAPRDWELDGDPSLNSRQPEWISMGGAEAANLLICRRNG